MSKGIKFSINNGQAMVTLLFFMIVAITITSAAVTVIISHSLSTSKLQETVITLDIAESGTENAILSLLRNPNYTGETLTVGDGTVEIQVAGTNPKVITSKGVSHNFSRTLQIQAIYSNNILSITSWKELF